jgi:hypothetical protein
MRVFLLAMVLPLNLAVVPLNHWQILIGGLGYRLEYGHFPICLPYEANGRVYKTNGNHNRRLKLIRVCNDSSSVSGTLAHETVHALQCCRNRCRPLLSSSSLAALSEKSTGFDFNYTGNHYWIELEAHFMDDHPLEVFQMGLNHLRNRDSFESSLNGFSEMIRSIGRWPARSTNTSKIMESQII